MELLQIVLLVLPLIFPAVVEFWYWPAIQREEIERFDIRIRDLQNQFRSQNDDLWMVTMQLGRDHFEECHNKLLSEPYRPLVFLLVGSSDNSENTFCLSRKIASTFDKNYALLNGSEVVEKQLSKADLDISLGRKISASLGLPFTPTVILFTDLGALSYKTASVFFKYCDNEDAPYRQTVFIFTLTLDADSSSLLGSSRKEITSKVYEYLRTVVWKEGGNASADALIGRIVNPFPLLVMKEDSSVLKKVCG